MDAEMDLGNFERKWSMCRQAFSKPGSSFAPRVITKLGQDFETDVESLLTTLPTANHDEIRSLLLPPTTPRAADPFSHYGEITKKMFKTDMQNVKQQILKMI